MSEKDSKSPTAASADGKKYDQFPLGRTGFMKCTNDNFRANRNGWCPSDGSHIIVRSGPNYAKTKKKAPSAPAMFECIHVDGFSYPMKVPHISRYFTFPEAKAETVDGVKPFLVCNWLLPRYAPPNPLWGAVQDDGLGWSLVFVFRLTDAGRELLNKGTTAGAKLVKRFLTCADGDPIRERLKAIARLVNLDEVPLNMLVKRVVQSYNNTLPWMTRPQQQFFKGPNYLEITFDSHMYRYVARKTFHVFYPSISDHIFDLAFVVEADKDDELPEHIMGACRLVHLEPAKAFTLAEHYDRFIKGLTPPVNCAAGAVTAVAADGKSSPAAAAAAGGKDAKSPTASAGEVDAADAAEIDAALAEVESFRSPATPSTATATIKVDTTAAAAAAPTAADGTGSAAATPTGATGAAKKKKKKNKKK